MNLNQDHDHFLDEGDRWLADFKKGLHRLEVACWNRRALLDIIVAARSLRTASALRGLQHLSEIMRIVEGLFEEVRRGERQADEKVINVARRSGTCAARTMARLKKGEELHA